MNECPSRVTSLLCTRCQKKPRYGIVISTSAAAATMASMVKNEALTRLFIEGMLSNSTFYSSDDSINSRKRHTAITKEFRLFGSLAHRCHRCRDPSDLLLRCNYRLNRTAGPEGILGGQKV
jgi:hypothetical protein